jgi:protein SCO1/2
MKRFARFIILAVIGFGLGAGLAYFQASQEAKQKEITAAVDGPLKAPDNLADVVAGKAEGSVVVDASKLPAGIDAQAVVAGTAGATVSGGAAPVAADGTQSETAASATAPVADDATLAATAPAVGDASAAQAVDAGTAPDAAPDAATAVPAPQDAVQAVAGSSVGGAFALTDHNGQQVTDKSWPGKYTLVFFGFTHCPDVCPVTLDKLTVVLNAIGADNAAKIQPLFITTDAARDNADTIKTYLSHYHPSILGLTGTEEQLKAAQDAYKVYAAKVPTADGKDYSVDHSAYVFMMSPEGQLLRVFKSDDNGNSYISEISKALGVEIAPLADTAAPAAPAPAETPMNHDHH